MTTPRSSRRRARGAGRRKPLRLSIAVVAVAALLAAGLYWLSTRRPAEAPAPAEVAPHPEAPGAPVAPRAEVEPEAPAAEAKPAAEPLPALDASDPLVRELVGPLSPRPALAGWLARSDLVRRFVVSVDNVAEGRSPRRHLPFLRPAEPFRTTGEGETLRADPASYARYDAIAEVVASLDAGAVAAAFERLSPLFREAYRELGHPDRAFEDRVVQAIDELLATPVVEDARLAPHIGRWVYADPELERLPDARKQLLRMGPHNVQRVQARLREIRAALPVGGATGAAAPGATRAMEDATPGDATGEATGERWDE